MKAALAAALAVSLFAAAPAGAEPQPQFPAQPQLPAQPAAEAPASPYTVLKENVRIPFASSLTGFRIGADKSVLIDGPGRRWYRVQLDSFCQRDLPWENHIGLSTPTGSLDRFDILIVDGRRCFIRALDQIEDPRPVDRALRPATKALD
jgi:hypothetical protein